MPTDPTSTVPSSAVLEARAKTLPRRLPVIGPAPDLVPARMINEVLYCERLLYLEWAQGEFADNVFTVEGRATHKRADQPGGKLPAPAIESLGEREPNGEDPSRAEEPPLTDRPYQARTLSVPEEGPR